MSIFVVLSNHVCLVEIYFFFVFTFIDDYSRKTWVYFLKVKFNVFSCLKKFKALIEKENGYYIKSLRIDRM
jgi:5'-3' exoribonuclease 2